MAGEVEEGKSESPFGGGLTLVLQEGGSRLFRECSQVEQWEGRRRIGLQKGTWPSRGNCQNQIRHTKKKRQFGGGARFGVKVGAKQTKHVGNKKTKTFRSVA